MRARFLLPVLVVAAVVCAGPASARSPRLHGEHPCPGVSGYTCATLDVPLDHAHPGRGTLHLRVGMGDNVHAPRGVLLVLSGGPGQPGLPILDGYVSKALPAEQSQYRIVVFDQRGTGAGALDCKALQRQMGSSDLTPPTASRRPCVRPQGGTAASVLRHRRHRRRHGGSAPGARRRQVVARRDLLRHVRRRALRAGPSVTRLEARARLGRAAGGGDRPGRLWVRGGAAGVPLHLRRRLPGRHRDRRPPRPPRAAAVRRADVRQHRRPDVPQVLERAGGAARGEPRQPEAAERLSRRRRRTSSAYPADLLDQGLHASTLCADWRFPWGTSAAPLAGRAAKLRAAVARIPAKKLYPFDRQTASGNGFVRQCLPWAPTPPTPLPHGKLRVPTLLVEGNHDLSTQLTWARQQLALTPHGKLVVVPGAGHSVQSRAVSDVGRNAVAHFLLGT